MKPPLYLTENLPGGQLPHVLWRWHVGLLSQKQRKKILIIPLKIVQIPLYKWFPTFSLENLDVVIYGCFYTTILGNCINCEKLFHMTLLFICPIKKLELFMLEIYWLCHVGRDLGWSLPKFDIQLEPNGYDVSNFFFKWGQVASGCWRKVVSKISQSLVLVGQSIIIGHECKIILGHSTLTTSQLFWNICQSWFYTKIP